MNDQLPDDLTCWQYLEQVASVVFKQFGYYEIRIPVVEKTELFARSIGQATDIVEKVGSATIHYSDVLNS